MRAGALAALLLVVAGCAGGGEARFESASEETRVVGPLAGRVEHRPNEGTIEIPIRIRPDRVETVVILESPPGQRPSDEFIAVYRASMGALIGDRLIATGTRDARGVLVVEKVEVRGRGRPYSTPQAVGGPLARIESRPAGGTGVALVLQKGDDREELVLVPGQPGGQPPGAPALELQQELDTLVVGDWVVARGDAGSARDPRRRRAVHPRPLTGGDVRKGPRTTKEETMSRTACGVQRQPPVRRRHRPRWSIGGSVLLLALPLFLAAGCALEKKAQIIEPSSDATHVSGTLAQKDDQRPVDGGVALAITTGPNREEVVLVPSLFTGQPPTSVMLALQQKVDALQVGDRLTATGTRNGDGTLVAEVIEVHEP